MADVAANTRRGTYYATWDSTDLGGVEEEKGGLKAILLPVTIGSAGPAPLDYRFEGLAADSMFTLTLREPTVARIKKLACWDIDSNAVTGALPAIGAYCLQYARSMTLHPTDVGSGDTTQDVIIPLCHAHPEDVVMRDRNPKDLEAWSVRFLIYPDTTKAGTDRYLYMKGT